jgi:hypothetical protein
MTAESPPARMSARRASSVIRAGAAPTPSASPTERSLRWLLLVHQLPARPSNLRVRTWRRLQQLGAVAIKQAVYALPDSPSAREDFEWLRTEIEAGGGHASVFAADTVDAWSTDDLVEAFRRSREHDYAALVRDLEQALRTARRKRTPRRSRRTAARIAEGFGRRLAAIQAIDFFGSAGHDRAALLVSDLTQTVLAPAAADPVALPTPRRDLYHGRLWVTRPRPGIDRMGSAWLIRRFIDAEARFAFADQPPETGGAVPFDMFGVEFTHRGEWCTFETLADAFAVANHAVNRLAAIVHDLDLKDSRFGAAEAAAIGPLVDGLQAMHADDDDLLEVGMTMFEALFRAFERATLQAKPRPVARPARKHADKR